MKSPVRPKYRDLDAIKIGYNALVDGGSAVEIPVIFSTDSTAIIGRKGSGKTTLARVLAEGLIERHLHPVIIDPLDVWWGLRAAADGTTAGLDVVIFGGSHADLPITEQAAPFIADLIVDKSISAVLVLDEMKQAGQRRFVQKFLERLFERKRPQEQRTPLHVIIDEADTFVPQNPMTPEAIGSLSEVDRAVRHGRSRGIGTTVISQRPAKVNKDVLTQCEVLFAMQVTGAQDRKALKEWTDAKATEEQAKDFWKSLASMKRGQAWIWSPSLLNCFQMVDVDLPWTYDSSFTPTIGGKAKRAAKLKDLDLASIKDAMSTQIEEMKANDPKELKARIKQLEAEQAKMLRTKNVAVVAPLDSKKLKAEILHACQVAVAARDLEWENSLTNLIAFGVEGLKKHMTDGMGKFLRRKPTTTPWNGLDQADRQMVSRTIHHGLVLGPGSSPPKLDPAATKRIVKSLTDGILKREAEASGYQTTDPRYSGADDTKQAGGDITGPERKVLAVLAQHADQHAGGLTQKTVAARAGYSLSGTFSNILGSLRSKSLITGTGSSPLVITNEGKIQLGHYEWLPAPGVELREWWKTKCSGPEGKVLDALATGGSMSQSDLAAACGYSLSGTFSNILGALRTKGLIVGKGREPIQLHEDLA